MSWYVIDIEALVKARDEKHEETSAIGVGGATTSANVAGYAKPFGPMLRFAPYPYGGPPETKKKKRRNK